MAKLLTPRPAIPTYSAPALSGSPKPITTWPERSHRRSARPASDWLQPYGTCRITSGCGEDFARSPAILAPFLLVLGIGKPGRGSGPRLDHELGILLAASPCAGRRSDTTLAGKRLGSTPIVMANAGTSTTNLADGMLQILTGSGSETESSSMIVEQQISERQERAKSAIASIVARPTAGCSGTTASSRTSGKNRSSRGRDPPRDDMFFPLADFDAVVPNSPLSGRATHTGDRALWTLPGVRKFAARLSWTTTPFHLPEPVRIAAIPVC